MELPANTDLSLLQEQLKEVQTSYVKLSERFSGMGKVMIDNHAKQMDLIKDGLDTLGTQLEIAVARPKYNVRPNKSETIGKLSAALSKVQKEMGSIKKSASAHKSSYADMIDICEATTPILEKYELSTTFLLNTNEHGDFALSMILSHSSGEWIETTALLRDDQAQQSLPFHQKIGYAEKYLRRYMYRAMICLAEEG